MVAVLGIHWHSRPWDPNIEVHNRVGLDHLHRMYTNCWHDVGHTKFVQSTCLCLVDWALSPSRWPRHSFGSTLPKHTSPVQWQGFFLMHIHSLCARVLLWACSNDLTIAPIAVGLIHQHILTGHITHCATPVNSRGVVKLEKTPTQPTHAV